MWKGADGIVMSSKHKSAGETKVLSSGALLRI